MLNYLITGWLAATKLTLPPKSVVPLLTIDYKREDDEGRGGGSTCYCLSYAKAITGKHPIGGSAYGILATPQARTTRVPRVGAIALMHGDPRYGHSAAVIAVTKTQVKVQEKGWAGCEVITKRWIPRSSVIAYYY